MIQQDLGRLNPRSQDNVAVKQMAGQTGSTKLFGQKAEFGGRLGIGKKNGIKFVCINSLEQILDRVGVAGNLHRKDWNSKNTCPSRFQTGGDAVDVRRLLQSHV